MAIQIVCFLVSLVVATSLAAECPGAVGNDWVVASGTCYRYVNRALTWKAAQKYCSSLGFAGSLAVLDSDFARQKARETVKDNIKVPEWLWTGITAEGNNRKWKSADGTDVKSLNWRKGEPNNSGGKESYVSIYGKDWNLNDASGSSKYPFICQVKPQSIDLLDELKCPSGWRQYNQVCVKYIDSKLSWYDAQERCSMLGQGGSLAVVTSEADNNKVLEAADSGSDYWIGISDLRHDKTWSNPFGKRISYSKWKAGEPNNFNTENCVHVYKSNRLWNNLKCSDKRAFVCQISAEFSLNRCPPGNGWVQSGDMCYRYFCKSGTWSEALSECRKQGPGGTLPFINSYVKNNEVYEAAAMSAGGEYSDNFKNFWIGVTDKGHSNKWSGPGDVGNLGNFRVWADNEPNNGGLFSTEDYVEMYVGSKKWNDENGDEDAFVCQLPAQPEAQCSCPSCPDPVPCPSCPDCPPIFCPLPQPCPDCPLPEPCPICEECPVLTCPPQIPCPPPPPCECPDCFPPEPKCDQFWTEFQGSCYLFNGKKVSQQKAKEQCETLGADLLMINLGENGNDKFLNEYISLITGSNKSKKNMVWVDMNDKEEEGVFMQGDEVFDGKVDAQKKKEQKDCVVYKKGVLSHEKCGAKRMYVCMKELPVIAF